MEFDENHATGDNGSPTSSDGLKTTHTHEDSIDQSPLHVPIILTLHKKKIQKELIVFDVMNSKESVIECFRSVSDKNDCDLKFWI